MTSVAIDYTEPWSILCSPEQMLKEKELKDLLVELQLEVADDLSHCPDEALIALADCLQPISKTAFLYSLAMGTGASSASV